jgi:hypothetical protein
MTLRTFYILSCILLTSLISCTNEKIETGQTLKKETLDLIKSLGLSSDKEQILKYYSNFEEDKAGNFFTTKRISHYWLDEHDKGKNDTSFAFYSEIAYIDTLYEVLDTFAPYMTITKKDSSKFKVYIGGNKNEMKSFFEEAIMTWKKNRN